KISQLLHFEKIEADDAWKKLRIAVVDGSDSPVLSERVGGRYGTFAAGYHIYSGLDLKEENYFSGIYVDDQIGSSEASQKVLQLMTTELERRVALECLEKVDLLFIDGPFFGFRPRCRIIADKEIRYSEYGKGIDLVNMLVKLSQNLLKSGKVHGIVKRVQTSSIDGWTIYKSGDDKFITRRNDKDLLASFMKPGELFSCWKHFGAPEAYQYLSRLAQRYKNYGAGTSVESIYEGCKRDVEFMVKRDLGPNSDPPSILRTRRTYIRTAYPSSPFAIDSNPDANLCPV